MSKKKLAQPAPKRRGNLLTAALIVVFIHGIILSIFFYFRLGEAERVVGNLALLTMFAAAVADVVAAAAMWLWKRWGMWVYGISAVVSAVVAVLATGDFFLIFGALLPAIIVLYIVTARRQHFV
jgi:hypothetical protein